MSEPTTPCFLTHFSTLRDPRQAIRSASSSGPGANNLYAPAVFVMLHEAVNLTRASGV